MPESDTTTAPHGAPLEGLVVVGVGASAGGLDAFKEFLEHVSPDTGIVYIFIQHLDPTHESLMVDLLSNVTRLTVKEIEQDDDLLANHVYFIPPGRHVHLEDGRFKLTKPEKLRGERLAIDQFFESLAGSCGRNAVGVVLAGTGSDGSIGLRAIRGAGGFTIAQDPNTADHASMPRNAIEQGGADVVLPIRDIPRAIKNYAEHPYVRKGGESAGSGRSDQAATGDQDDRSYHEVIDAVKLRLGVDLSGYKETTLFRRIQRRMSLNHVQALGEYIDLVQHDERELRSLARDIHINVTDFFRDEDAFRVLQDVAIPKLLQDTAPNGKGEREIRVWVPGCSTGEEAYSIAIAFHEAAKCSTPGERVKLQLFATDIVDDAIRVARAGSYPVNLFTRMPASIREVYFDKLDDKPLYRVKPMIRDSISFARHDLFSDPPFSSLHMISCRNLLIYMKKSTQESTIELFHFALKPEGILMLGSSEGVGVHGSKFRTIDKAWKIFQRLESSGRAYRHPIKSGKGDAIGHAPGASDDSGPRKQRSGRSSSASEAERLIVKTSAPPCVLINDAFEVLYIHGQLVDFLELPSGVGKMSLHEMLREGTRTRIRAALYRASRTKEPVSAHGHFAARDGSERRYRVDIRHCASRSLGDDLLLLSFHSEELLEAADKQEIAGDETVNRELEQELASTREDLRATVQELENANEELRTSNEEAMTTNEELQSTNEELETQSEELRSVNEELSTVNVQLREKIEEVQEAHADITNLLSSTKLPAIFLDRGFCIRRYTPEARRLLNVIESDVGRPLGDLSGECLEGGLLEDARSVLDGLTPHEKEIATAEGRWYIRRILPYRTEDDRIDGVVITFSDVTRLKKLAASLEQQRSQQAVATAFGVRTFRETTFKELAQYAVEQIKGVLDCDYVKVLKKVPGRSELRLIAGVGWQDGAIGALVPTGLDSQAGYTLTSNSPVVVEDLKTEKRFSGPELLHKHGVRSGVSVILHSTEGNTFGVLGVHSRKPMSYCTEDIDFVQQMANLLAFAAQRIRSEKALAKSQRELASIIDYAPVAIYAKDHEGRYVLANRLLCDLVDIGLDDLLGKTDHELPLSVSTVEQLKANDARVWETGEAIECEEVIEMPGGNRIYITQKFPLLDTRGETYAVCGISTEITNRKRDEKHLRDVMAELNHRVKNTLAVIEAISRQTLESAKDLDHFKESFGDRLRSMASAHALLTKRDWVGTDLASILRTELESRVGERFDLRLDGPHVVFQPKEALALHMAIHELATNAAKYGALSTPDGLLSVTWTVKDRTRGEELHLRWTERGGPVPEESRPAKFGSKMIDRVVAYELGGEIERGDVREGFSCSIRIPLQSHKDVLSRPALLREQESKNGAATVLIVEDRLALADQLVGVVTELGYTVLGPAPTIKQALSLIGQKPPSAALLDIDLNGEKVYPVANRLSELKVPFAFVTGYDRSDLPEDLRDKEIVPKPISLDVLEQWLCANTPV